MHKQRIWILGIAALGLLTAFLPWVTVMGLVGVSGIDTGQGWVVLVVFGVAAVVALTGPRVYALDGARRGILGVLGAGAIGFGIWKYVEIGRGTIDLGGEMGRQMAKQGGDEMGGLGREMGRGIMSMFGELYEVGFGLYIIIAAGLALVVAAVLKRRAA